LNITAMPRNIEIKARVDDLDALARKVADIADEGPFAIEQDDTFFQCPSGRLKLRAFSPQEGELIFYRRPDRAGPKESFYLRSPTASPDSLREVLYVAYGSAGRVRKRRVLYLVGRTRIHLDAVEGLGSFVELEVVLCDAEAAADGEAEAMQLMQALGVSAGQLVEAAYVDLLPGRAA
jgi:predicted adenylyl cyclase CyaB